MDGTIKKKDNIPMKGMEPVSRRRYLKEVPQGEVDPLLEDLVDPQSVRLRRKQN